MSDDEPLREQVRVSQRFAREQRRQGIGGRGCADCGMDAPPVRMIGTGAARLRLCPECQMHRERIDGAHALVEILADR